MYMYVESTLGRMGQCICTLCTLPTLCVSSALAPSFLKHYRPYVVEALGWLLTSFGVAMFVLLNYLCKGVNFYGGNSCWSTGEIAHAEVGILATFGLGVGPAVLVWSLRKRLLRTRTTPAATPGANESETAG